MSSERSSVVVQQRGSATEVDLENWTSSYQRTPVLDLEQHSHCTSSAWRHTQESSSGGDGCTAANSHVK